MPLTIGQTIGRYRIEEQIGAGGMGVVYRAHDKKLERDLAIKVLSPGALGDPAARKRFRNEARVLSRLNHPAIQTIYDFDELDGYDLLISEFVPGVSLDTRLHAGQLTENELVRLGVQLAEGLAAAHAKGVLHRDLKPSNMRVTPDGRLKILDFGLATLVADVAVAVSKTTESMISLPTGVAGTLPYMSPEQLLGDAIDERSDIYAAGVVFFELVTGHLPFNESLVPKLTNAILNTPPPSPASYAANLSPELEQIILKCLEKDAELRYQSAEELAADLRRLEAGSLRVATVPTLTRVQTRRWNWRLIIIGACTTAMIAGGVVLWRTRASSDTALPSLRWEQITDFNDSAQWPTLSADGRSVAFIRGPGGQFGSSAVEGQIWVKPLPGGDAVRLTNTPERKITLAFSPDGTRIYFTQVGDAFTWNTYEVPLFGGQEPKLFMANATGLSWIGRDRLLFSSIKSGIHMVLETSAASRTDQRDIYIPSDHVQGMVHRSALSPDGKWVLAVEMDNGWNRCRLVPFDGGSSGTPVGPEGECTAAAWSPDGEWMYFTVNAGYAGSHIWRQRFRESKPQQLTRSGASEEEGLAVMPDGQSLITAAGTENSEIWLHDQSGDRQISSEGFSYLPALSPDGKRVYYLRRSGGAQREFSGELWASDLDSGSTLRLFPGLLITHFALSADGKKIVFASAQGRGRSGIWTADLDGTQPPRQLTTGGEYRAFYGRPGEVVYQSNEPSPHLLRINEDGSGRRLAFDQAIMQLQSVSPDGRWAIVGTTPPGGHGDRNTVVIAVPLAGGEAFTVCDRCSFGYRAARMFAPLILWSMDGKWLYVAERYFGGGRTAKTVALPISAGTVPYEIRSIRDEATLLRNIGAHAIPRSDVFPSNSPSRYVFVRASAKTNLFRIYLSK